MNNCTSCEQMKKENKQLRANRDEIHKNYVEVVNENLAFQRMEDPNLRFIEAAWKILDQGWSERILSDLVDNAIRSWKASKR